MLKANSQSLRAASKIFTVDLAEVLAYGSRQILPLPLSEEQDGFRKDEAEVPPLCARLLTYHLKAICRTYTGLGQGDKYIKRRTVSGH